jgi:hypothetical protein
MATFEDLLGAMRKLNDPISGVTRDWKSHLRIAENQAPEVKTNVERLSACDDVFNTELHPFINITAPDSTTLAKLIELIEGYLVLTNGLYDSLLNLKNGKSAVQKTVKGVRDAHSNVHETLRKVKAPLSAEASLETPITISPSTINFRSIIGGPNPPIKAITIHSKSSRTLIWYTEVPVTDGNWLLVTPPEGTLEPEDEATLNIAAFLPQELSSPSTYTGNISVYYRYQPDEGEEERYTEIPILIQVTFDVHAPCTIVASPTSFPNFDSAAGQTSSPLTITANGTDECECEYDLLWMAVSTASWLSIDSSDLSKGIVHLGSPANTTIGVDASSLNAGTYTGKIVLTAVDGINNQPVRITDQDGTSQIIEATLMVHSPCSLGLPSQSCLNFSAEAGAILTPQSLTIGIDGYCTSPIMISASTDQDWLTVTTSSSTISGGNVSVISVTATPTKLLPGAYSGSISILANDGNGKVLGSPQTVDVSLNVIAAPALLVSPSSGLDFKEIVGKSSQTITIKNTGGESLQWQAKLANNAPGFVDLSANSGLIQGGASSFFNVTVDATGITGNATYNTSVIISATDPTIPLNSVVGSPVSIPITINIASDALFLTVMKQLNLPNSLVVRQTQQLFKREHLTLNDLEIDQLTKSWDKVVAFIADPSRNTIIKNATGITDTTLSDLFTLHSLLEQLYDRLESNVRRSEVEIIGQ